VNMYWGGEYVLGMGYQQRDREPSDRGGRDVCMRACVCV